jgi:phospholipase C
MMENQSFDRVLGFVEGVGGLMKSVHGQVNEKGSFRASTPDADPIRDHRWDPDHSVGAFMKGMWGDDQQGWPLHTAQDGDAHGDDEEEKGRATTDIDSTDTVCVHSTRAVTTTAAAPTGENILRTMASTCNKNNLLFTQDERERMAMSCFAEGTLPCLQTLAREFLVFDRWHASIPGPTGPNRMFAHAAQSGGYAGSMWRRRQGLLCPPNVETIEECLDRRGISWGIYHDADRPDCCTATAFPYIHERREERERPLAQFFHDCEAAEQNEDEDDTSALPQYCWLVPELWEQSQHPCPQSHEPKDGGGLSSNMLVGDNFIGDVY